VWRGPGEPRPPQPGDQPTVQLESFVDGEPLDERDETGEVRESTIILDQGRVVPGLYEGLLGIQPDEEREITVHMPEDHASEQVRGKDVLFKVNLLHIQERLLPDWDELPVLEEVEGTLDELREKTRAELEQAARESAERQTLDAYIKQLVEKTEYDIPDALIEREADDLLHQQGQELERYGITLDQMLKYRGKTHDEAVEELRPQAEERLKSTLALREVLRAEKLSVGDAEVDAEVERMLETYEEEQRAQARDLLSNQLRPSVASSVLDKKLRKRVVALASGSLPALEVDAAAEQSDGPGAAEEVEQSDEPGAAEEVEQSDEPGAAEEAVGVPAVSEGEQ